MFVNKSSNKLVTTAIMAIAITLLLLSIATPVTAQSNESKNNLATIQGEGSAQISPGGSYAFNITFYNVDGNRATHVRLDVVDKPENWEVRFNPEKKQQTYSVSGIQKTLTENMRVPDPYTYEAMYGEKPPLDEIPENPPEGFVFEEIPMVSGYVPTKKAQVIIHVPEEEGLGKTSEVKVKATGFWLGSDSMVSLNQVRDFNYKVTTASDSFYEVPVEPTPSPTETEQTVSPTPTKDTDEVSDTNGSETPGDELKDSAPGEQKSEGSTTILYAVIAVLVMALVGALVALWVKIE